MQLNVPQLKTVLDAGTLSLEGRDLGTKDGKISGKAQIDAREAVTAISANFKGEGVDVYALSAALGITPMIEGDTAVTANVSSRGNSQRQLVEQLSGNVTTNMPAGAGARLRPRQHQHLHGGQAVVRATGSTIRSCARRSPG